MSRWSGCVARTGKSQEGFGCLKNKQDGSGPTKKDARRDCGRPPKRGRSTEGWTGMKYGVRD